MKTQFSQFTCLLVLCGGLALTPSSVCAAGTTPAVQDELMAAQIQVTRDTLAQVLSKMKNDPNKGGEFSNPDFVAKANAFNETIEPAMQKFEATLKDPVLKQAGFYIQRLEAIQKSSVYTPEQKKALLTDQIATTRTVFKELSKKYAQAIYDLYILGLPEAKLTSEPKFYCKSTYDGLLHKTVRIQSDSLGIPSQEILAGSYINDTVWKKNPHEGCTGYFENAHNLFYNFHFPFLRNRLFSSQIRSGCFTSACVALYSNHRMSYVNLISNDIDKPIYFWVAGTQLTIEPLYLAKENILQYFRLKEGETSGMPFDISESEYRRAIEVQKIRDEKIARLKTQLMTPSAMAWRRYSWNCPNEVQQIKSEICSLWSGSCLTEAEQNWLARVIEADTSLMNKPNRVSCLKSS